MLYLFHWHTDLLLSPSYQVPVEVGKVGVQSPAFIQPVSQRRDGIEAMFSKQKERASPTKSSAHPGSEIIEIDREDVDASTRASESSKTSKSAKRGASDVAAEDETATEPVSKKRKTSGNELTSTLNKDKVIILIESVARQLISACAGTTSPASGAEQDH